MQIHIKWSEAELASLKEDYGVLLPNDLEQKYGKKYSDIRSAASRHGIKSKRYTGRRRFWTKEEEQSLVKDWEGTKLTAKELAQKYNRSLESIKNKARELKLQKKEHFISEEKKKDITELYGSLKTNGSKMGATSVAKKIGVSPSAIRKIIKEKGGQVLKIGEGSRKYEVNSSYFDNGISTHDCAYILGLFYADGYNNEEKGAIGINLKASDASLLQEISNIIGGSRPIKILKHKYKGEYREYAHLYIGNREISEGIAKLGVVQNKSLIAQPPEISDNFFMSFLRGTSDGDGSITLPYQARYIRWGLCGASKQFMLWIKHNLERLFPSINFIWKEDEKDRKNRMYYIDITSSESTIVFLNELYRDVWQYGSKLYLPRKYEKIAVWKEERQFYEYGDISKAIPERSKILHRQARLGVLQ